MDLDKDFKHIPVLYEEALNALNIKPDGIYVDATAGGGGHSKGIAERLTTGTLISIDRDPDAIEVLKARLGKLENVIIVNSNYSDIDTVLDERKVEKVDGVLVDLGVSSFQLDNAERGFSYHHDAPLDMRMSKSGITAADIVNTIDERGLARIIASNGEERYAKSIAKRIVRERQKAPILTTFQLAEIVKESVPVAARKDGHPARKTFQALRIEVNGELDRLSDSIDKMFDSLKPGGRLAIITFHSLEDRIVKQKFASYCEGCTCPKDFPVCVCGNKPKGKLVFKYIEPSEKEIAENNRSRSAKLRAIEKL